MIAVLAAVLALGGAPATPFACSPTPLNGGAALGLTHWEAQTIEVYGPVGCAALLYAGASSRERVQLRRLNPGVDFAAVAGLGLLVDLHEALHVGMGTRDECAVEKVAMAKLPQLVAAVIPQAEQARALTAATAADAGLPGAYHGC